jgi:hypothetical protein
LVALSGTSLAKAPANTIQFIDQARLQPDGSVVVTVDYSCFPPSPFVTPGLDVRLSQPTGSVEIITGATCDGTKHMEAFDLSGPFAPGPAAASATIFADTATSTSVTLHVK